MNKDELIQFSQEQTWHYAYPARLVRRFLNELISSDDMVFDLHDSAGRAAVAVLVDLISNPANDANLEILGIRQGLDPGPYLEKFADMATQKLPAQRSGFQMSVRDDSGFGPEFFSRLGLKPIYSTYEMENPALIAKPIARQFTRAEAGDGKAVYDVLCESFAQNLETSIPEEAGWLEKFGTWARSHIYLCRESGVLVGFAHLVEPDHGAATEVRNIGVLPSHRGQAIGHDLLQHCLNESLRLGYSKAHLTVAAENERALSLYLKLGFRTQETFHSYRKSVRT